jgi:hypothetical protein
MESLPHPTNTGCPVSRNDAGRRFAAVSSTCLMDVPGLPVDISCAVVGGG